MTAVAATIGLGDLRGDPRRLRKERAVRAVLQGAALLSIVISGLIVLSLVREAWTFISQVEWASLWTTGWFPRRGLYDIKTLLVGSLLVTAIAMAVAVPVGLGAAVYLAEYASTRVRRVLKPALEILAGIPSVVLGFFALTWISPQLVQRASDGASLFNLAAAGIAVGILTVPLVASISVAVSRAIGETMVVAIAAGATGGSEFTTDVLGPGQTMTAAMAAQAAGTDAVRGQALTFQSLFFVGLLLFLITLGLNLVADRYVR